MERIVAPPLALGAATRDKAAMASRRRVHRTVTLARALSKLGALSRTAAREAILAGRVAVDGLVERDPDAWLDPDQSAVALDGVRVHRQLAVHLAMHKPLRVVTTRRDERGRPTVYDLLPPGTPKVSPIGRLDLDSSGLLLLTNDTQLGEAISGPGAAVPKTYEVQLDGPLSEADAARFAHGLRLPDGTALQPVKVRFADPADRSLIVLVLREGKNRQIRRMAAACGRSVARLHRVAIGPVVLGDLPPGATRPLTARERAALAELAARRRARRAAPDRD
jgi:23S rRNA pseudouridine2605 synthase